MKISRSGSFAALSLVCSIAHADILYRISPDLVAKKLNVSIEFDAKGQTDLQMPTWMPGAYVVSNFWKSVEDVAAQDSFGQTVTVAPQAPGDTWRIYPTKPGKVKVSYRLPLGGGRFGATETSPKTAHISGPGTYMYVVGRKEEKCKLDVQTPPDWKVAIGINEARGSKPGDRLYEAKTYDVLADNPITLGDFLEYDYTVRGKKHVIAMRGDAAADVDKDKVVQITKFISESQTDFFGGAPYDTYVWHFSVMDRADGGGGLEHLSSTQIGLGSGVGPRSQSVISHEFFHLWNVKRIRSKVLGPFDYRELPKTGALWWLEGVTDYYASVIPHRYGWWGESAFYKDIVRNTTGVRSKPARFEISPYDASYRVGEANNGKGNSDGLKVSYYNTGWLLGMVLDIELRSRTAGKYSLDDVERALFDLCKDDKPGFAEDGIRTMCVRFGGAGMGEFYDQWVTKPGELPVEAQLAKVGLALEDKEDVTNDLGFLYVAERASKGVKITSVTGKDLPVAAGDIIVSANGVQLANLSAGPMQKAFRKQLDSAKPGSKIALVLGNKPEGANAVEVTVGTKTTKTKVVRELETATPEQKKLREGWFFGNKGVPKKIWNPE